MKSLVYALASLCSLLAVSTAWAEPKNIINNEAPVSARCVSADGLTYESCGGAGGPAGDGAINDGVSSSIKATVFDFTNSNPLGVVLRDTNGDYVSVGGGTQYSQGTVSTDTDVLTMSGCVRADTAAIPTGVLDGDRVRCIVDSTGRLWTFAAQSGTWNIGTLTTLTSITNPVAVTGTFWQATQPVSGTFWQATQPISGTVTANAGTNLNTSALLLDATYTGRMPAGASPADNESNTNTALSRIGSFGYVFDGATWDRWTGAVSQSGTWNITNISGTVSLPTGAATAANQDGIIKDGAGDTTQANVTGGQLHVNCGNCSGSGASHVDNAAFTGGTDDVAPMGALYDTTPPAITDGNMGAPRMDSDRYLYTNCIVGCSGGATTPTDNFANPTTAGLSTSFGMWWDGATWDRAPGNATDGLLVNLGANNDVVVSGTVTVTDGAGALNVICDSGCGGGTQYNQGTATTDTDALTMAGAVRRDTAAVATGVVDGDRLALSTDSVGRLRVTAADTTQPISGTVTVTDGAGALNVIVDSITAGDNNIGNVDIATMPSVTIGTFPDNEPFNVAQINGVTPLMGNGVTGTGSQRVTIASDNTAFSVNNTQVGTASQNVAQIAGTAPAAHDAAMSGDAVPLSVAAYAETPEDSDGNTNANRSSADGDKQRLLATRYGELFVREGGVFKWTYHEDSSSALTDTTVHASCGTGLFNYITHIAFSTNAASAASVKIEDSTTTTILGPYYLEAIAGRGVAMSFPGGKKQTTSATLISVTTTGAIAHGLDIQGFCAP